MSTQELLCGAGDPGGAVVPDDLAVLAGDVKLEHVPALGALYQLQGDLGTSRGDVLRIRS